MKTPRPDRRQFVAAASAACSAPLIWSRRLHAAAANDRLQIGFIGVGKMGRGHLNAFLGYDDVQVVAVSDVVEERRDDAGRRVEQRYADGSRGEYSGCGVYNDYRELLARDDVDAVVISTPDHWHAMNCIDAARHGKDIYCEKPLTRTIAEGRAVVNAMLEHQIVFQTGSQQRSEFGGRFRRAVELIRNGLMGDVHTVRIGVGAPAVPCDLPGEETPEGTDWNLWVGPAEYRDYNEILCPKGLHNHFPAWRRYQEYAGGGLADMGAHHFDIAQWALGMDETGPVTIEPPEEGDTGLKFTYANGIEMFHGGPSGCTFECANGMLYVDRPVIRTDPPELLEAAVPVAGFHVDPSDNHKRNWLEAVRARRRPIAHEEIGHRTATICHLGNIGYRLRRPLSWDPDAERFDDDEAQALVHPPWREFSAGG